MHTPLSTFSGSTLRIGAVTALLTALSACGGEENAAPSAHTDSPEQTVRTVASSISSNMGVNMDSVTGTADKSSAVSSVLSQTPDSSTVTSTDTSTDSSTDSDDVVFGAADTASALALLMDDDSSDASEDIVHDLLLPTLGIGGNGQITSTNASTGTLISIDPDEASICAEWLGDTGAPNTECTQLLGNLTVQVNAINNESGTVTYFFSGQTVLTIEYAPTQGSYELSLPGMKTVLQQLASQSGDEAMLPQVMQGAIKLSATVINETPGAEAGSFDIAVTQPIRIEQPSEDALFALASSNLLSMSADAASGTASMAIALTGLEYAAQQSDGFTSTVFSLNLPAFTASASLSDEGNTLVLTDTGMGNGPLTVALDGTQVLRMKLPQFAAMINGATGTIDILEALNLDLLISDLAGIDDSYNDNSSAQITISAPANTRMHEQSNDTTLIETGGPFVINYNISDGIDNPSGTVSVTTGECFNTVMEGDYDLPGIAPCP
jgi:hypothetical protein